MRSTKHINGVRILASAEREVKKERKKQQFIGRLKRGKNNVKKYIFPHLSQRFEKFESKLYHQVYIF